ncbi:MAG: thioredoxin-dependent thiol peroxidase [Clostridium argentinense]|uniref:thioredoxin-dependent peroxiredoxin n=1 Tax=Clostridium faecium TaxID=2762223 RepID=A0ABR8YUM1_9CLOT|nr:MULTISPECIES: thioredoxin-dependent thiol peroxidase [Clostridium]MBD8047954.1 thioredoxin-dependent thiol peroxidase [Clostridium faecium]MBS5825004.1 thioredoxin-dependent thiol peroxidase [Clostridium argentinense]MDU1350921.1 thioredoxin-dependent thiol peroxidase [Clostridium argentinense]
METLKENTKAPDFSLPGSDGKTHKLSDYIGKNVVLYFYPKDNTPGCTKEALAFKEHLKDLDNLNTVVLGISKDNLTSHEKFINKHELNYILLSDVDKVVCELYNVLKEKTMFGKKSIGIERSTFIINKDGNIAKIFRKVKVDGHIESVIDFISNM